MPETVATPAGSLVAATGLPLELYAMDDDLFGREFFPEEFKQETPEFHHQIGRMLNDQLNRYVGIMMFRGSAKTTKVRVFAVKRAAFGISRTIALVSLAQSHSITNLQWIKNRIEAKDSKLWSVFGMKQGRKWAEDHIEIENQLLGIYTNIVAKGMTGQIRGLNIDGSRPDLIIADDISDDETTKTPEAREKARSLFFGGLLRSLTPATENPDSKMVLLQTPLQEEDIICTAVKDPTWATMSVGCFDEATGDSVWPDRFPTADLRLERQSYVHKGLLRIWLAEMECKIVGGENTDFRSDWLKYWTRLPERMITFMSIDPVPPPSNRAIAAGLKDNDFEVLSVVGIGPEGYYLLDQVGNRGHDPEWTISQFFALAERWKPIDVTIEGVAYQRVLKYILEKAMRERRRYVPVKVLDDKRGKRHRIVQSLAGVASQGRLFIHAQHADFQAQFLGFPHVSHDDYIDSAAMGIERAQQYDSGMIGDSFLDMQQEGPLEIAWRHAP